MICLQYYVGNLTASKRVLQLSVVDEVAWRSCLTTRACCCRSGRVSGIFRPQNNLSLHKSNHSGSANARASVWRREQRATPPGRNGRVHTPLLISKSVQMATMRPLHNTCTICHTSLACFEFQTRTNMPIIGQPSLNKLSFVLCRFVCRVRAGTRRTILARVAGVNEYIPT